MTNFAPHMSSWLHTAWTMSSGSELRLPAAGAQGNEWLEKIEERIASGRGSREPAGWDARKTHPPSYH